MVTLKAKKRLTIPVQIFLSGEDFWVGQFLIVVGLFSWIMANSFDARSQAVPLIISRLLVAVGFIIIIRAVTRCPSKKVDFHNLKTIIPIVLIITSWGVALSLGAGFVIPTFIMQCTILWIAGICNLRRLIPYAFSITAGGYVLFALILNIRFPSSIFSYIAPGF